MRKDQKRRRQAKDEKKMGSVEVKWKDEQRKMRGISKGRRDDEKVGGIMKRREETRDE